LLLTAGVVAGAYTFEAKSLVARLAPFFLVATLATILLAQYRAILLTVVATGLLIAVLVGAMSMRGAVASALVVLTFLFSLSYVSSLYPDLKYAMTVGTLTSNPGLYFEKRLKVAGQVNRLYTDDPQAMVTGTGPGTYSSRAWYVYAQGSTKAALSTKNPGSLVGYHTDVSDKYVLPRLRGGETEAVQGSYAVTSPFSSYTSLLAEVGIFGFMAMILLYGGALLRATRMFIRARREAVTQDPLPGVLLGSVVGFFVLLQMAVLENWLEVTRLTFLLWAIFAVATKEFAARHGSTGRPLDWREERARPGLAR
jgi:hypothetical protein